MLLRSAYASRTKRQLRGRGPSHPEQNPFGGKGGERSAPKEASPGQKPCGEKEGEGERTKEKKRGRREKGGKRRLRDGVAEPWVSF